MIPETASRAVKEYLATLDDAAFGAASDVTPKFVSPSDPAAQWTGAMRGPAFFAYADNYLIDVKFGVIMDVEASRAIRQAEVGAAKTMIERTEERFGMKPERLAADTAYGSAAKLNWLVNEKQIAPHIPVIDKSKREDGTFSREDFTFDKARDIYICPAGKVLTTTGTVSTDHAVRYIAPVPVAGVPAQDQSAARTCRRAGSCADVNEDARDVARALGQDRGLRAILPRSQARRDAVRPSQAHPQARPPPAARPARRARRVHARSHRPEPAPAREVRRPDRRHRPWRALRKRRVRQCQCVEAAVPSGAHGNKALEPLTASAQFASSNRRLLQQNLPRPELMRCSKRAPKFPAMLGWRSP